MGNTPLALTEVLTARRQGRLHLDALDRQGTAVDTTEEATPLQGGQVTTDRLGGDLQLLGEHSDLDAPAATGALEDQLLSLRCVHRGVSRFAAGVTARR